MAKSKKTPSSEIKSAEPKSPAPAAEAPAKGAKTPAKKGAKTPGKQPDKPSGTPLIDTNLVAQAAAAMLVGKAQLGQDPLAQPAEPAQPAQETSAFKQMKEQLAHPRPAALSHLLGGVGEQKKSGAHSILDKQKGHNQTLGHFNKTGVPRRTNG